MSGWYQTADLRWLRTVNGEERGPLAAPTWPEAPREYLVLQQRFVLREHGEVVDEQWRDVPIVEKE